MSGHQFWRFRNASSAIFRRAGLRDHILVLIWLVGRVRNHRAVVTTGRSRRGRKSSDKGSSGVLVLFTWLAIGLDFALSFQFPRAAIRWERTSLFFIGIAFILGGTAFRLYSMSVLGRFFTYYVAVNEKQTVVKVGPYHYIRHPSYTGALIVFVGLGLALGNWAGLLALLACVGIGYAYRISVEETVLAATLGEPYQGYMRRTRRLVPFLF